jgi:hypothetical protein
MKRNLLFILAATWANLLSAQTAIEITPPNASVSVNATNQIGATASFNVKLFKNFPSFGFYAYSDFTVASSSLSPSGTVSVSTVNTGLKTVTCNIPNTALAGETYSLIITVADASCLNGTCTSVATITVDQVLSVTWSSFEALSKEKSVLLSWTTEAEKDNSHFVVEHSTNGTDFSSIGEVKAIGNSNTTNKYQYEDTESNESVNYYRIRAISLDGTSDVSKIVSVVKKGSFDVKTFPTAQGARVQIGTDQTGEEATLQVVNLNGQVISSQQIKIDASITDTGIDFQDKGIFIINIKTATQSISKKLLKY